MCSQPAMGAVPQIMRQELEKMRLQMPAPRPAAEKEQPGERGSKRKWTPNEGGAKRSQRQGKG